MGPPMNRAARKAQTLLTANLVSKVGVVLIAVLILVAMLGAPARLSHVQPATWLLSLWWAALGLPL